MEKLDGRTLNLEKVNKNPPILFFTEHSFGEKTYLDPNRGARSNERTRKHKICFVIPILLLQVAYA